MEDNRNDRYALSLLNGYSSQSGYSSHITPADCFNYDAHNRIDQESPYNRAINNYQKGDTSQAPVSGSSCMQSGTLLSMIIKITMIIR